MPTYVVLANLTDQGIRNVKSAPDRVRAVEKAFEAAGARMRDFYLTMGAYDYVAVVEAPDDETVARLLLATGTQGNVRTTTLRAFNREEFGRLVEALP